MPPPQLAHLSPPLSSPPYQYWTLHLHLHHHLHHHLLRAVPLPCNPECGLNVSVSCSCEMCSWVETSPSCPWGGCRKFPHSGEGSSSSSPLVQESSGRVMCPVTGEYAGLTSPAAFSENLVCHMGATPCCSLLLQGVLGSALPSHIPQSLPHALPCLPNSKASLPPLLALS